MHAFQAKLLSGSFLVLSLTSQALAATACTGTIAAAASELTSYQPALSYCSSKYPVATVTVTSTAEALKRRTVLIVTTTSSKLSTLSTSTRSSTSVPTKKLPTKSSTTTTTTTRASTSSTTTAALKSNKAPRFNSVLSQPEPTIASFCTCLQGEATTTVPPTTTTTTTTTSSSSTTTTTTTTGSPPVVS